MSDMERLDLRLTPAQVQSAESDGRALARLLKILKVLRGPGGCPWDREQTHHSLRPYLLEECHEVLSAIDSGSMDGLREELGDLSLHVAFQAELAEEGGAFRLRDSLDHISDKLIRRHPHVFGGESAETAREVERLWEAVKAAETDGEGKRRESILDGVPVSLPGLLRAQRIQEKVEGVGFQWPGVQGALDKLEEELGELRAALAGGDPEAREEELGDLLFSLVNVARYLRLQPEDALRRTNDKFIRRFRAVEHRVREGGGVVETAGLAELDRHWEQVKVEERSARRPGAGDSAKPPFPA